MSDIILHDTPESALEKIIKVSSNPSLSVKNISLSDLEGLTFKITSVESKQTVSVIHYLFYTGQGYLFNYLIEKYNLTDLNQSQLVGPPLILIVIRLYLDPERFVKFYQLNHKVIFAQERQIEFYWLFFQNLLKLGWYVLPNQYRLVEICLEIALTKVTAHGQSLTPEGQDTQAKLIKLYQALYQIGFQIGLKRFFKNYKVMRLVIRTMPNIYEYIQAHYSATLIQAVYRRYHTRKSFLEKSLTKKNFLKNRASA